MAFPSVMPHTHTLDYRPRSLLLPIYTLELALPLYAMNGWFKVPSLERASRRPLKANHDVKFKFRVLCATTRIWLQCLPDASFLGLSLPGTIISYLWYSNLWYPKRTSGRHKKPLAPKWFPALKRQSRSQKGL